LGLLLGEVSGQDHEAMDTVIQQGVQCHHHRESQEDFGAYPHVWFLEEKAGEWKAFPL